MSKNLTRKGMALVSGSALVLTSLVGVAAPANANTGTVTHEPTAGTRYAVFNTDEFQLTTRVVTQSVSAATLSYALTDENQGKWYVKVGSIANDTGATNDDTVTFAARDALGAIVDLHTGAGNAGTSRDLVLIADGATPNFNDATDTSGESFGEFVVDFKALGATTLYLSGFDAAAASNLLTISPYEGSVTAETDTPTGGLDILSGGNITGNTNELDWSDGDVSLKVQSWIDLNSNITNVEALYSSPLTTIDWFDPRGVAAIPSAERFVDSTGTAYLNDLTADGNLASTISFGRAINLDQFDITKWEYKIGESTDAGFDNISGDAATEPFVRANDLKLAASFTNHDGAGRLHAVLTTSADAPITLAGNKDYIVSVKNTDASGIWYGSVAYVPPVNAAAADQIQATVQTVDDALQANADTTAVRLRTGTKVHTYRAQIKTDDTTTVATPSIQVLAIVRAGAYLATGGGYTVSGATSQITRANQAVIVTGFTNSDGRFSVTVTSNNAATDEAYTITFYVLNGATDTWTSINKTGGGNTFAAYTATYEAGTATTLTPDSSVVSGTDVKASFTVTDQFGVVTNKRGSRDVSVELKSSNGTTLDLDAPVAANGTVSFTFKNYVAAGASDVLTATTYTGSAGSPAPLGGALTKSIQLYNPAGVSVVQAPATLTANITYKDFLADGTKASSTKPAPDNGVTLTGTVVDANSVGVPAAPVTISGTGLQFKSGDKYYNGKVDVTASAAGVYSVEVFAQKTNSTGVPITITSAGKTATTTLKTYLPATGVNGNNLKFEVVMPANVVKNTTYAVTVKLTDKWGNPIQTSTNNALTIQGFGSVQINSTDNATTRQFGRDGTTVVFLRSVKDIAGPGSVTASLAANSQYSANAAGDLTNLTVTEITTDVTTTAWNETLFTNSISANVEVLETKPASAGEVAIGSFNSRAAVRVEGLQGQRLSVKIGKKWYVVASIPTNRYVWSIPSRKGAVVKVDAYINGDLENTQTITVK